jgi:poly [ADP-ribose] polymerase
VQLLESDTSKHYVTWTRWGRVGVPGQSKVVAEGGLDACMSAFSKKFKEKTSNSWDNRCVRGPRRLPPLSPTLDACLTFLSFSSSHFGLSASFTHVKGKYDMVKIDYTEDAEEAEAKVAKKAKGKAKAQEPVRGAQARPLFFLPFQRARLPKTAGRITHICISMPTF